jgi:hypothetical protein
MRYSTYCWIQWGFFLVIAAATVAVFTEIADTGFVLLIVLLFVFSAGIMVWTQFRLSARLDDHGGSIPMPGIFGLIGFDIEDDNYDESSGEAPDWSSPGPRCPRCGFQSHAGDDYCPKCGEPLGTRGQRPSRSDPRAQ